MNNVKDIIRVLDPLVANKIAAGEVIERPSAVVKELVENSLDAGSKRINITVSGAGRELIEVSDDGFGIVQDQLKLSILRHATSKLFEDDLYNIRSFGFRGEALPSIGAVSNLEITTKPSDQEMAFKISLSAGKINEFKPASRPDGTTVTVRDLFYNLPARKKFLKTDRAEQSLILKTIKRLALSRPDVALSYNVVDSIGNKTVVAYPAVEPRNFGSRLGQVFGSDLIDNCFKFSSSKEGFKIEGYASIPTYSNGNANQQNFFVNSRPISDRGLSYALKTAYGDLLPKGRYCSASIRIYCEPRDFDVNVHPTKEEIRFETPKKVNKLLIDGIREGIRALGVRVATNLNSRARFTVSKEVDVKRKPLEFLGSGKNKNNKQFSMTGSGTPELSLHSVNSFGQSKQSQNSLEECHENYPPLGYAIAQIHDNYIIARSLDGMVMVDQHAAHERLTYEKLKDEYYKFGKKKVQTLLVPVIIEMDEEEAQSFVNSKEQLKNLGLDIESFGPTAISVSSTPAVLGEINVRELILDLSKNIWDLEKEDTLVTKINEILSKMACHSSIRSGRRLSIEEMNALLRQVESVPYSSQCNHGRPTFIELSLKEIEKLFGRT